MLLENAVPILALAIDDVPIFYNQHLGALSQKLGEVTDAESGWLDDVRDIFFGSELTMYQRYLERVYSSLLA
ncbi:hypothetical protein D3C79_952240 [compost metagenome]